ncbi:oligopeptide ABC transporter permease OppB [Larsenimonas salina]|uniref:oligopeptide ABC transporter permease OppB n=1 Tax=Larsenimonas salina TaxID=1295565 RepID=UPI0020734342|nr:oligopeptide ABC transporter permease OppB [Larsenimonas salina]MCM5705596.1 oligopeptide ABC transporter permease OppB [Larsenimonas salina]
MLSYTLKRLAFAVPTLLVVITISFFLMRAAPGGPFDGERQLPPEIEANLKAAYHLDEPLPMQYLRYMGNLAQGDFGPSFKYKDFSVTELIMQGFPVSLEIGGLAIGLALLIGLPLGVIAALKRNSTIDYLVMSLALGGIAVPNFVIAPIMALVFGVLLGWLPAGGWNGGALPNLVLPVIALSIQQIAYIARMMRASMIETMGSHFIRTARAKGLSEVQVVLRHALRPSLLPVVSYLGPAIAAIVTGSVVIEQIFGIPGIGRYFVQGALNRDYTLVMGTVVFYGALIVLMNLLVDLLYSALDPQIRYND